MFVSIPPRRRRQWRWVTPALLLLLAAAFVWTLQLPPEQRQALLQARGMLGGGVPSRGGVAWQGLAIRVFSASFLHADWSHLIGNLAFLMIFGLPAERMMGSLRFLALFLLGGAVANLAAASTIADGEVLIGASGGVSAVIGAWLVLFPRARLGVVVPLGLFLEFVRAPAALLIGVWALLQVLFAYIGPAYGQVAWVAHLAGFGFGGVFALLSRAAIAKRLRRQRGY